MIQLKKKTVSTSKCVWRVLIIFFFQDENRQFRENGRAWRMQNGEWTNYN
jgi:hypothetical protein